MRGVTKKVYISILTSILVLLTTVATTYAWVGIFTYSSTGNVDINLKVEETKNNYFLTISPTGNAGTFTDSVNLMDIQKQIMDNLKIKYDDVDTSNENAINKVFTDRASLVSTTARLDSSNNILEFEEMTDLHGNSGSTSKSEKYYKFDLYLSVDTKEGINLDTANISADVALVDIKNSLVGTKANYNLVNGNTIINNPNKPSSFDINKFPVLGSLPNNITIDSSSAARFALEVYEPIDINNKYTNETPINTIFYQGGTMVPTVSNGVYSLGGILPEEYNLAVQEVNSIYHSDLKIPDDVKNRQELELIETNNKVYLKENNPKYFLGVKDGVQTKMKITVYFWFEGWDADCISAIDRKNVTLNLTFTSDLKKENRN